LIILGVPHISISDTVQFSGATFFKTDKPFHHKYSSEILQRLGSLIYELLHQSPMTANSTSCGTDFALGSLEVHLYFTNLCILAIPKLMRGLGTSVKKCPN
jgi:hypothetical protein